MRSFVTFLAAAASLQGSSAAPFGNLEQSQATVSHSGFPQPTGGLPQPTGGLPHPTGGFPHPTGGLRHPESPGSWAKDAEHHRPTPSSGDWQGGDHWGFTHPTSHHFPHPSGGFPRPTEHPGSGNGLWGRDADRTHPSSHHPHPTGGSGHHHRPPPPGDDKDHGRGNQEKRDEKHHRPTGVAGPSGIPSVLEQHRPANTVAAGQHPDGEPKRERAVLQEVPRVVQDAI
ncbi:uncharacterized protein F4812DRAFT_458771 [Daldinia caldariorum]|uniref:uncharacterized protein n=1 Tax=Daldinia caldariorum TaxID=326644 RepID=UPI002007C863|nr:uncharacterized protein F4812DRAFT_458771 [Daldinia caldariorum]KAI1468335.1 hypothetical protein F4812DRAFT_458771 [Daldinia caldariorum]